MWLRVALILICVTCFTINSYGCPVAVIAFDPDTVSCYGTAVDCNGSGSYDNDGSGSGVVSWKWDFDNDGFYDDASGETVDFDETDVGSYIVRLKVTDDEGETDTASKTLYIVEPVILSSSSEGACVDCNVAFLLTMNGGAVPDDVSWSAPGGNPSSKEGDNYFTTSWSTTGSKTVTVTLCDTTFSKTVTIADVNNFQEDMWLDLGNGELYFEYTWDSTSGNLSDLTGCKIEELVYYPVGDPYIPSNPPFDNWSLNNPTTVNIAATLGAASDTHSPGGGFSTPYVSSSFSAVQFYRQAKCDGTITYLMGPLFIDRSVYQFSGAWKYKVEKSGHGSIKDLP